MNTIAVYGTLKEGNLNNVWYLRNAARIGSEIIKGYQLYVTPGNTSYPIAVIDKDGEMYVEIYDLPDKDFLSIKKMEETVGYVEMVQDTQFGIAKIFIMPTKNRHWPNKCLTNNWNQSIN